MDGAFDLLADNFLRGRRPNVVGRDLGLGGTAQGRRPLPAAALRAVERRRRRRQTDPDRPGRRPRVRRRGRRRARRRAVRRAVHRRRSRMREARRADPHALGGAAIWSGWPRNGDRAIRRAAGSGQRGLRQCGAHRRSDQREIAGLAGEPLAFRAIAARGPPRRPARRAPRLPACERGGAANKPGSAPLAGSRRRLRRVGLGLDRIRGWRRSSRSQQALKGLAGAAAAGGAGALCASATAERRQKQATKGPGACRTRRIASLA